MMKSLRKWYDVTNETHAGLISTNTIREKITIGNGYKGGSCGITFQHTEIVPA
jgi:hypothetical protein